jgi:hypothetical protein
MEAAAIEPAVLAGGSILEGMSRLCLVPLLCWLLLPLQGQAQPRPSEAGPTAPALPPPLVAAPEGPQEGPAADKPWGGLIPPEPGSLRDTGRLEVRIPVGLVLGTVGGAVGAVPGALIMALAFCRRGCVGANNGWVNAGLVLAGGGLIGGAALTIDWLGDRLGGHGRFWPTVLGVTLGTGAGIAAAFGLSASIEAAGAIPAILGPAVGGVIAYELSSATVIQEAAAATASRVRLVPLVAMSPRGGLVGGVAGSF